MTQRIRDLVNLATDPGASFAEARTAAMIACKEIKRQGFGVLETMHDPRAFLPAPPAIQAPLPRVRGVGRSPFPMLTHAEGEHRPGVHEVNLDFRDEEPGKRKEFAFPQGLWTPSR